MSSAVRTHLVHALEADLVGPFDPAHPDELLPLAPSRWYVTGFLVPPAAREAEEEPEDDEMTAGPDEDDVETGGAADETAPKQKALLPSSVGLSVLLPPGPPSDTVDVELSWAEYAHVEVAKAEGRKRPKKAFKRVPRPPVVVPVRLDPDVLRKGVDVTGAPGMRLTGKLETTSDVRGLDPGTRALALFLVNDRAVVDPKDKSEREEKIAFQVAMEIRFAAGIVARTNRTGEGARDFDDRVADLQFRARSECGVGHGVSVEPSGPEEGGRVPGVRIRWLPCAVVRRVVTNDDTGRPIEVRMERLAELGKGEDPFALSAALSPIVEAYGDWIATQRAIVVGSSADTPRDATKHALMDQAERARGRMREGIARLEKDQAARLAFAWTNEAMAMQARKARPNDEPRWRLFQLAFVLQCIEGVVDDQHVDRDVVDLIFFPTGGGKTEAYLGVIAFTLLLRRIRGASRPDGGLGVAVLLRYTLRLLTLDQLARAARLVCALEILRRADPARLGDVRFAIGLWVGKSATANTFAEVKKKLEEYKASVARSPRSPFPLTRCPWCDRPIDKDSFRLVPKDKPADVVVSCLDRRECPFGESRSPDGLPVLFVDEQVYGELPAFLLATVDKFAMLPWRGETGLLFGRATARKERRYYGPLAPAPKGSVVLPDGLPPPELIVQDELHLISGPLGTMCGLYETAIDALASRPPPAGAGGGARVRRPKVLASTATVRRAREQVRALFGRSMALFPPPGVNEGDTFFAKVVDDEESGRLYVGVAATGRPLKQILIRTYLALLAAARHEYDDSGPPKQTADAYMTLAGYFNSLRELGGMRRLVDDDVRARASRIDERRPDDHPGPHPWFGRRPELREPVELTSREPTARIAQSKARLEAPWATEEARVDVLLASNMISVGVDIDRLGVMVVAGQPKTTSEYIQASSRVGRKVEYPGLVVTCFNMGKPRDRSHYERFRTYHECFYRFVEAQSLTPFSGPALDRGLAGMLVAMTRLGAGALTPPEALRDLPAHRAFADACVEAIATRGSAFRDGMTKAEQELLRDTLRSRGRAILDAWQSIAADVAAGKGARAYSPYDKDKGAGKAVLYTALEGNDRDKAPEEKLFAAPTSMRDVEPSVHLWVERRQLGGR
ncbi:MAG: DISARM system helicase DrmA [Labilithrix sp.]|nr:DISARM system helicase DrmA [Labilithrix sp.]MCW5817001.1 DISARM system helicase DrmA [Labilithrix sp.]